MHKRIAFGKAVCKGVLITRGLASFPGLPHRGGGGGGGGVTSLQGVLIRGVHSVLKLYVYMTSIYKYMYFETHSTPLTQHNSPEESFFREERTASGGTRTHDTHACAHTHTYMYTVL